MGSPIEEFMREVDVKEQIRERLKRIASLSLKDILAYAISCEKEATKLYMFLYENVPTQYQKEYFKQFIDTERSHDEKVERIFKTLFPNEEPKIVESGMWRKLFERKLKTVKDYLDILKIAMESEKLAEEMYLILQKHSENLEHKRIFMRLANDEKEHYMFVAKEYDFYRKLKAESELKELISEIAREKEKEKKQNTEKDSYTQIYSQTP
ncbi:ferritin family protein [Thermococcus argininiproducens]|uniref:Ferritin family protein n=1 Tax=Thermococcus argininiproducens TaxID=2866384 RepID=A0A9E7MBN2_9EURY|nr:ferritin family protein [Thermococcus argininiproducens]USH00824.1 ferritin family protein [Thermococcus argininiproducens]